MNKCIFGAVRLTRDPEVRYSEKGTPIARFSIAIDRRFKNEGQPTADFVNCIAFSNNATFAEKYLKKGTKVNIEAHVQTDRYTNKDGQTVYTTDFIVDSFEFCESKSSDNNTQPVKGAQDNNNFMNVPNSLEPELPFN